MTHHQPRRSNTWRMLLRLWPYLRAQKPLLWCVAATIICHAGLRLLPPYFLKVILDQYLENSSHLSWAVPACILALVAICVVEYAQSLCTLWVGQRLMLDVRMEMFQRTQRCETSVLDRSKAGDISGKIATDVAALYGPFSAGIATMATDVLTVCSAIALLIWLDWRLALVLCTVAPLVMWMNRRFRERVQRSNERSRASLSHLQVYLSERIAGMQTVQLCGREGLERRTFDGLNGAHRDSAISGRVPQAMLLGALDFSGWLVVALMLLVAGAAISAATLTIGTLIALVQYTQTAFRLMSGITDKINALEIAAVSAARIFELLDGFPPEADPVPPRGLAPEPPRIEFEDVSFSYRHHCPVLRNVSFTVAPNESIALVGPTGAGKSTILGLLLRLYEPDAGRIRINGVDIRHIALHELRSKFGCVIQDTSFFASRSTADNLLLRPGPDLSRRLRDALEAANALSLLDEVPVDIDEPLGERATTLSAGQRQLLALARALATNPAVLVLDEATGSIDLDSERRIRESLKAMAGTRSIIAIAHRLSLARGMDRVLVLSGGTITEMGTHEELLRRGGTYYRMYRSRLQPARVAAQAGVGLGRCLAGAGGVSC